MMRAFSTSSRSLPSVRRTFVPVRYVVPCRASGEPVTTSTPLGTS